MNKQSIFSSKLSKKSPTLLWLLFLFTVLGFGIYICYICFQQISIPLKPKGAFIKDITQAACSIHAMSSQEIHYVHFPNPKTYRREECECTPVRLFVIMSMQRSGSGWFETLLNSHPNVSSNGEIFSVKQRRSNISTIQATLDTVYALEWVSSSAKNDCVAAVGLKWMLNQADLLARYKPTLNVSSLISDLSTSEHMMAEALEYFKSCRHLVLYYEDLMKNHKALSDAQEFLRVPFRKLVSHQVKIHVKPLSEQINNWEEVYSTLEGSKYEYLLHHPDIIL
ncbi:uncharacterized protein LOC110625471 isoform X2 [Manihot esculenta]|uniref:Sulfotransferase n=1 Tax=Manihot esculenta TaxID=3983 RepID=A0A2C9UXC9_MANES|nr:uncharacterized protein LOC110625471 isoform X2 [Manihot esculenta]